MGLRTILYGYRKEHLLFYIVPDEADIVRRIFREYISGKTMKSIADALTAAKVIYYMDKYTWTKNAVCRIIENKHYAGDMEYPAIVSREDYITANEIKADRGGKREPDSPDVALLKRKVKCAKCGHRYTRRKHYVGNRERWECTNCCKLALYLNDETLFGKLTKLMNRVIDEPDILHYDQYGGELYEPTLELIREDREIDRMTEQKTPQFLPIKGAIFNAAANRYDCCRLDLSRAVTDKLIGYVRTLDKSDAPDFSLIERIVKRITVHPNGALSITFLNDKTINEREDNSNADGN